MKASLPNPDDLDVFCRVAQCLLTDDTKSLARHALDLGLSKSRVEHAVLRISSHYGQELVGPSRGHGKRLTTAGHALYERALPYLDTLEMMSTDAQPVVVPVSDTIQSELLPGILHQFLHAEGWVGKVMLHIRCMDYRVIKDQVLQGHADFGLGWNVMNERSSFVRSFQPGFHMGLITPPAEAHPPELRLKDVAATRSLLWTLHPEFLPAAVHRMVTRPSSR